MTRVTLEVDGVIHSGWLSLDILRSIEDLSGSFSLSFTNRWSGTSGEFKLTPGQQCSIKMGKELIMTGYIEVLNIDYDADSYIMGVSGRDKAGDLVDCHVESGYEYTNIKIERLITQLAKPFGIGVRTEVDTGAPLKEFSIGHGETIHSAIARAAAYRSCLVVSDKKGDLIITRAGENQASTGLVEGWNILSASATYDFTDRFSRYTVRGSQEMDNDETDPESATQVTETVLDSTIQRYRPFVMVADGQVNFEQAKERAAWERSVRRGKSRAFTIEVATWLDRDGKPWEINQITDINAPHLGVRGSFLISAVRYSVSNDKGEIAELELYPAEAFKVNKAQDVKSADEDWIKQIGIELKRAQERKSRQQGGQQ